MWIVAAKRFIRFSFPLLFAADLSEPRRRCGGKCRSIPKVDANVKSIRALFAFFAEIVTVCGVIAVKKGV